jgi:hypothetical protein
VTDRVRGVVEARLDGAPGLLYLLGHDDELVDRVPDLSPSRASRTIAMTIRTSERRRFAKR